VLDWQHFALADVTALGYQIPTTGQGVLGLGLSFWRSRASLGSLTRKRKQFATVSLFVASSLIAWLVAAHVTRSSRRSR
jgi:hypothetical protein